MMRRTACARLLSICTLLLAACDMYDPGLYRDAQGVARAADACSVADVPLLTPSNAVLAVTLESLDDSWQVANCGSLRAEGNDGFFAVDIDAGRKVHFHVNAVDPIDPVLYVVDSCDERGCQPLHAASHCPGDKEHLSFIAPRTSRYYVGVDSVDPGGGRIELLAIAPRCGDADKEHSESCEDGNTKTGDGCDAFCRHEIVESGRNEVEPNDDLSSGNVLGVLGVASGAADDDAPAERRFSIVGTLEGPCDPEVFSFAVASEHVASIRLLAGSGDAQCRSLDPQLEVEMRLFEGLSMVAQARSATPERACPSIEGERLAQAENATVAPAAEATYHIELRALGPIDAAPLDYTLEIELEER